MAITVASRPRASWFRAKNLVFGCIALMAAYVIRHNEHFIIDRSDPFWQHIQTFKWWLLPHGLAGACAPVVAPPKCIVMFGLDDNVAAGDTINWICLVLAIPLADVVLQLQESWRTRTPAAP